MDQTRLLELVGKTVGRYGIVQHDYLGNPTTGRISTGTIKAVLPDGRLVVETGFLSLARQTVIDLKINTDWQLDD